MDIKAVSSTVFHQGQFAIARHFLLCPCQGDDRRTSYS